MIRGRKNLFSRALSIHVKIVERVFAGASLFARYWPEEDDRRNDVCGALSSDACSAEKRNVKQFNVAMNVNDRALSQYFDGSCATAFSDIFINGTIFSPRRLNIQGNADLFRQKLGNHVSLLLVDTRWFPFRFG